MIVILVLAWERGGRIRIRIKIRIRNGNPKGEKDARLGERVKKDSPTARKLLGYGSICVWLHCRRSWPG